jgi:hypothetical protein
MQRPSLPSSLGRTAKSSSYVSSSELMCFHTHQLRSWASGPWVRLGEGAEKVRVLPKRRCSGNKTCSCTQHDESSFHLCVSQCRFTVSMSGQEKVLLGLTNSTVWGRGMFNESQVGMFNESQVCRCALGVWLGRFPPALWEVRMVPS